MLSSFIYFSANAQEYFIYFKYCSLGMVFLSCRHNYFYPNDGTAGVDEIVILIFNPHRVIVCPQDYLGWISATFFYPLITLAQFGNHDCEYICNTVGVAEYAASYMWQTRER